MTVSATTAATTTNSTATSSSSTNSSTSANNTVNYNEFLQLLVAQLQNQDPTNPADPTTFVSQLASFSSVEQQVNANTKLEFSVDSNRYFAGGFDYRQNRNLIGWLDLGAGCIGPDYLIRPTSHFDGWQYDQLS